MKYSKEDVIHATETLKKYVKKGTIIHCIVRSVAPSGMSRAIDLYVIHKGDLIRLTWSVAVIGEHSMNKHGYLVVSGCGMDMCAHVVYSLAHKLWGSPYRTNNGRQLEALYTRTL